VNLSCLAAAAYRSPSLEERFQFIDLGSVVRVGDPSLRPERSMSVNAGLSLHTDGWTMRTDVFLNHLTDLITELPGTFEARAALIKTNIGEARLYGFEITNEHMLARWAALSYQVSYVRGEDTRTHTNLPQIAPLNGRAALTVILAGGGRFEVSSTYAFNQLQTAAGEASTPGWATADAGFSSDQFTLGGAAFAVRAGIQNIFDKAYRTHLSTLRGLIRLEPGRNFYLSLSVEG
jgi:outer membrane receptor protein involved in Fe transport